MGHSLTRFALATGLAALMTLPASAATTTWQLDPMHTAAQFSVKHLAMNLPASAFKQITWREGTDRKLRSRFAVVRIRPAPWAAVSCM